MVVPTPQRLALFVCGLALVAPSAAWANGIYKYVEKDGTIVYTNVAPTGANAKKATRLKGTFHRAPREQSGRASVNPMPASAVGQYEDHIELASRKYNIPSALVRAVMHAESSFDPNAVSSKGASGLMQLMPGTARDMYVRDIFDTRQNIEGGTRYLRLLANEFDGDMVKMVAAYNAGPEAVRKYNGNVPPYPETQDYVRKVINLYFRYKAQKQVVQAAD